MELKDFVKETLLNVTSGVEEANKENGRFRLVGDSSNERGNFKIPTNGTYVDFDIGVIVTESKGDEKKSGIGIMVANFMGGTSTERKNESVNENINRLKFRVFIEEARKQ